MAKTQFLSPVRYYNIRCYNIYVLHNSSSITRCYDIKQDLNLAWNLLNLNHSFQTFSILGYSNILFWFVTNFTILSVDTQHTDKLYWSTSLYSQLYTWEIEREQGCLLTDKTKKYSVKIKKIILNGFFAEKEKFNIFPVSPIYENSRVISMPSNLDNFISDK